MWYYLVKICIIMLTLCCPLTSAPATMSLDRASWSPKQAASRSFSSIIFKLCDIVDYKTATGKRLWFDMLMMPYVCVCSLKASEMHGNCIMYVWTGTALGVEPLAILNKADDDNDGD